MHKFYSPEDYSKFARENPEAIKFVAASSGTGNGDWERLQAILAAVPEIKFICLDVANGYSEHFVMYLRKVRAAFPQHTILAGNVVTGEMVEELLLSGADIIKVGIGPGSVCTTRKKTGVGYPQLSAVLEVKSKSRDCENLHCLCFSARTRPTVSEVTLSVTEAARVQGTWPRHSGPGRTL